MPKKRCRGIITETFRDNLQTSLVNNIKPFLFESMPIKCFSVRKLVNRQKSHQNWSASAIEWKTENHINMVDFESSFYGGPPWSENVFRLTGTTWCRVCASH